MSIIEDGLGTGKKAGVNSENRLLTHAVTQSLEHHANSEEKQAYHLLFQQTPTAADTCFLYLKNDSAIQLILEGILLRTSGDEQIELKLGMTGTAVGTITTPVNCNVGSANAADGTFIAGNNITGLSTKDAVERFYIVGDHQSSYYNFEQDIILSPSRTCGLYAVNGSIEIDGTLVFHFHEIG